ncbi:MAG TPA: tyrosine-type recombinase/integrase [Allosphingosinicella sp.]|nr:tyrosine-type recombinase/integrase [Allosphingosinicella sp.]
MSQINPKNEIIKRRYLRHMQEARGLAASTIDNALRAIAEYERFTGFRDFGKFRASDATAFKRKLLSGGGRRAAELSNRCTARGKLQPLQRFFKWLAEQDGYRTKVRFSDVEFFNLSNHDAQIARDRPPKPAPSLEQVQHAIRLMPAETDLERRDRAMMCCVLLTGARVRAVTTLKLKHVRADRLGIDQDARDVRTKFSKSFTSFFFPVGDDIREMFLTYVDYLRAELRMNGEDPLFPKSLQLVGDACHFRTVGLSREHWGTADPVRQVFRRAFAAAGLPNYSPHTIRRTLTLLGQQICRTPEELKAWSQNLAHDDVLTTFRNYGAVATARQAEIITALGAAANPDDKAFEAFKAMCSDPRFGALFGRK